MTRPQRRWASLAASAACVALGCAATPPEDSDAASGSADAPWRGRTAPKTRDFLVTSIGFEVPVGTKAQAETVPNPCGQKKGTDNSRYEPLLLDGLPVDGFDLDGVDSKDDGPCPHRDHVGPNGEKGIDYAFLHVMDMIRPARPGQTIETVLASAPSQGLIRIGIRVSGLDDLQNDDAVTVQVVTTAAAPLLGANGKILPGSSVPVDPDKTFRSTFQGRIQDGVLTAGPGSLKIGKIDLLVAQDRVIALQSVRLRAQIKTLANGEVEVDSRMGGFWQRDAMMEAMGYAVQTIGANAGELECVFDKHADHALDGKTCDAMSTILRTRAVAGFITGLDDAGGP